MMTSLECGVELEKDRTKVRGKEGGHAPALRRGSPILEGYSSTLRTGLADISTKSGGKPSFPTSNFGVVLAESFPTSNFGMRLPNLQTG